ncbi:conjugal transfer protein TraN [Acinetobacter baumannii]|nr:conjugal transfer protein TraN [Acinetobacter baumannii]
MINKHHILATVLSFACMTSVIHAKTAEEEGRDFGQNSIQSTSSLVNTQNGQNAVPNYSTNAPESAYFQNGMGNVNSIGNQKVTNCQDQNTSGNNQLNLECEAINFVNKSATSRPIYEIDPKKDEVIQNSKQIRKESVENLENNKTCYVQTVKVNPVYEQQQCVQSQPYTEQQCVKSIVNDVCPVSFEGSMCNGITGINPKKLLAEGDSNPYISYENNLLKFGLGQQNSSHAVGVFNSKYTIEVVEKRKLETVKLVQSFYDDAYRLKINGVTVFEVNIGGDANNLQFSSDKELKDYFKEGQNIIELTLYNNVPNSPYRADLDLKISMYCACTKKTTNTCTDKIIKNPDCGVQSEVCLDLDGKGTCLQSQQKYICRDNLSNTTTGDCQPLLERGCTQIGSICSAKDSSGKCLTYSQTYRCEKTAAREEKKTVCVEAKCIDGKCYQATSEPDPDFGQAIAMMEVTREAGVYGEKDSTGALRVFNGEGGTCTVKLLAGHNIMSCCKEIKVDVSKASNNSTGSKQTQAMGNNPDQPAQQTEGSTYQYDDLYNDDSTMKNLQGDLTGGWLQCTEEERDLAVKRGGSLCTHAKTWCSSSSILGCTEESRSYCCFKSILAKIINREGRKQLGLTLESCEGITIEQLQKLDFSKIDMTEFQNSVVPKNVDLGDRAEKIKERVNQQAVGGYYSE